MKTRREGGEKKDTFDVAGNVIHGYVKEADRTGPQYGLIAHGNQWERLMELLFRYVISHMPMDARSH